MRVQKINNQNLTTNQKKYISETPVHYKNPISNKQNKINFTGLNRNLISDIIQMTRLNFITTSGVKKSIRAFENQFNLKLKVTTSFENLLDILYPLKTDAPTIEKKYVTRTKYTNDHYKEIYDKETNKLIRKYKYRLNKDKTIFFNTGGMQDFNKITGEVEDTYDILIPFPKTITIRKNPYSSEKEALSLSYKINSDIPDIEYKLKLKTKEDFILESAYLYDEDLSNNPLKYLVYDTKKLTPKLYNEYVWNSENRLVGKIILDFKSNSKPTIIKPKCRVTKTINKKHDDNGYCLLAYNNRVGKLLAGLDGPRL